MRVRNVKRDVKFVWMNCVFMYKMFLIDKYVEESIAFWVEL